MHTVWKPAPMSEPLAGGGEIAFHSPEHGPSEHHERQLKSLESSMPKPIQFERWMLADQEERFGEPKESNARWSVLEASQVESKPPTWNDKDALCETHSLGRTALLEFEALKPLREDPIPVEEPQLGHAQAHAMPSEQLRFEPLQEDGAHGESMMDSTQEPHAP